MCLAQEQPAARAKECGDDTGPAADVGQPAQRPDTGEHKVEPARRQQVEGAVDLGLHELDVRARLGRQPSRLVEGGGGEVEPGHPRPEPGEGDRVGADVALQMHAPQSADVTEAGQVEADNLTEELGIDDEPVDGVAG